MQICVICGTLSNPVLVGLVGKSIQASSFYTWRRKGQEDGLQGLLCSAGLRLGLGLRLSLAGNRA